MEKIMEDILDYFLEKKYSFSVSKKGEKKKNRRKTEFY